MSLNLFHRSKEIFQAALERAPQARAAYLAQACGHDSALRAEVEALLAAHENAPDFLERNAESLMVQALARQFEETSEGKLIGPFLLERELGRGGMGVVYLGHRVEGGFEQKAAIKLIKRGMDSEEILRRFRHERQTMASLNHPYIARLLDGGATGEGLPYFGMEYVEGRPIDEYCDSRKLDTHARLGVFLKVCEAVRYAHQHSIVHRDLKPSNILVNEEGAPKLLDFGIAKLLSQDGAAAARELTLTGRQPMTPHYASPEQARNEPISTMSDVYSLGVILYELLTGQRPYRFANDSPAEIERVICDVQPEKPSTAGKKENVDKKDKEPMTAAAMSEGSIEKLRRRLAGDLDNIVLKALRKEPQERYGSVEQFAEDIRRHLEGRPVHARKGTFSYRAGRFVRRHKYAVAAACLFFGLVLGFSIVTKVQANRIALERDKAEQVSKFLVEMFEVSDPNTAKGDTITAREILERGAKRIEQELKDQPLVQATLMNKIAEVCLKLGLYDQAKPLFEAALATRKRENGERHLEVAESMNGLAELLRDQGAYAPAESLYLRTLAIRREHSGEESLDFAETLAGFAWSLHDRGEYHQADSLYRRTLDIHRKRLGEEHEKVANSLNQLGNLLTETGDYQEADSLLRRALAIWRKRLGNDHMDVATCLSNLGMLQFYLHEYDAAASYFHEAIAIWRKILGPDHPRVAIGLSNLSAVMSDKEEFAEAEALLREALAINRKKLGHEHPSVATDLNNLAIVFHRQQNYAAAEPLYREALAIQRKTLGDKHPNNAGTLSSLAALLGSKGDFNGAEEAFREALEIDRETLGSDHPGLAMSLSNYADLLLKKGETERALELLQEALAMQQRALPKGDWMIADTQSKIGACRLALKSYAQAEPLLLEGYAVIKESLGADHQRTLGVLKRIVKLYEEWNKPAKAAEYRALLPKEEKLSRVATK